MSFPCEAVADLAELHECHRYVHTLAFPQFLGQQLLYEFTLALRYHSHFPKTIEKISGIPCSQVVLFSYLPCNAGEKRIYYIREALASWSLSEGNRHDTESKRG